MGNLVLLVLMRKKWRHNVLAESWLRENTDKLVFWTIILGEAVAAVQFFNSKFLGRSMFNMGLTKKQLIRYVIWRAFLTSFLRNVPQICIQFIVLGKRGSLDLSLGLAFSTSFISFLIVGSVALVKHLYPLRGKLFLSFFCLIYILNNA